MKVIFKDFLISDDKSKIDIDVVIGYLGTKLLLLES
jgi:hypothetical protein